MTYQSRERSNHDARPHELYKFEMGTVAYRYTSSPHAIERDGVRFEPLAISRGELDQSGEDQAGSVSVTLPADSQLAQLFAGHMPGATVSLTMYRGHTGDEDYLGVIEYAVIFNGTITGASFSETECTLTCSPLAALMSRVVPIKLFQPQCNHLLYSQHEYYGRTEYHTNSIQAVGCGVNKENYRTAAQLSASDGTTLVSDAFATQPAGWFNLGHVELPDGQVRRIESHSGNTVTLSYPAPQLQSGDIVAAYPGCDLRESTCRAKFNNVINFSGFTRMPSRNPFETRLT